jgi:membrane-bound lytic murein transglycosylase B
MREAGLAVPKDLKTDDTAKVQEFLSEAGAENWLTLHNFYVITRYNHSHLYAMAVFHLAQELGLPK